MICFVDQKCRDKCFCSVYGIIYIQAYNTQTRSSTGPLQFIFDLGSRSTDSNHLRTQDPPHQNLLLLCWDPPGRVLHRLARVRLRGKWVRLRQVSNYSTNYHPCRSRHAGGRVGEKEEKYYDKSEGSHRASSDSHWLVVESILPGMDRAKKEECEDIFICL